jgi:hypothetical protein
MRDFVTCSLMAFAVLVFACPLASAGEPPGVPYGSSRVADRNLTLAVILGAVILGNVDAERRSGMSGDVRRDHDPAPPMDPTRQINEQDCTKPIEHNGGNLRCK